MADRVQQREKPPLASGQVVIMFAMLLTVLTGIVGLALDGANLFAKKRAVQGAADLAALAAGGDLPGTTTAHDSALTWAERNGYKDQVNGATVTVTTPYALNSHKLEVKIKQVAPVYFLRLLGYETIEVEGRAVAGRSGAPGDYVIYAHYANCEDSLSEKGIDWSGSNTVVTGGVHSNSGLAISGDFNQVHGTTTYQTSLNWCRQTTDESTVQDWPTTTNGIQNWPIWFTTGDFTCNPTYSAATGDLTLNDPGPWWVGDPQTSTQLKPGVYCALNGKLKLDRQGASGTVTFIAQQVELSGSNFNLTAHSHDVLLFGTRDGMPFKPFEYGIKVSGSHGNWLGSLFAPTGQVEISGGSSVTLWGRLVGQIVRMNGSTWNIAGPSGGNGTLSRPRIVE